jgi:hypothetical protein
MKWLDFKKALLYSLFLLGIPAATYADENSQPEEAQQVLTMAVATDSVSTIEKNNGYKNGYDQKLEKYQRRWNKLIPTMTNVQYAGSMGLVSIGTGWVYGKQHQWETQLFFGYLPKFSGEHANITMTLKENYVPFSLKLGNNGFSYEPFSTGIYLTTVLNSQDFWVKQSDRYPDGYYWFSSRLRINACFGQAFSLKIPSERKNKKRDSISLFYEISTNDFYIIAFAKNKSIKLNEIFHFSFGIKSRLM